MKTTNTINLQTGISLPIAALNQTAPMPGVSANYGFIPTKPVIDTLAANGWTPVKANQSGSRDILRRDFAKHCIDFVNFSLRIGDSHPMIRVINSHDRTAALSFYAGVWRVACENGLLVGDGILEAFKVYHTGKDLNKHVEETVYKIVASIPKLTALVNEMRAVELTHNERFAFIENIITALEMHDNGKRYQEILGQVRRSEDWGNDLWTIFNRVQESVLTGQCRVAKSETNEKGVTQYRTVKARSIKQIDRNTKVNRLLFDVAAQFLAQRADIKTESDVQA